MKAVYIIIFAFILQISNVLSNTNSGYQPNWRWIVYPRSDNSSTNNIESTKEEQQRIRRNPNWGYQPNWRWIAYPTSDNSSTNNTESGKEEKQRIHRNPNWGYQPNWRWIAYPTSDNSSTNNTERGKEEQQRIRRNPNWGYQPNWRWIAYPTSDNSSTNNTESGKEEQQRIRRNPNWGYQPNWRWIAYPTSDNSSTNNTESGKEEKQRRTAKPNNVPEKGESHGNRQHSRVKPDEVHQHSQYSPFNHSFYEGWYQTPASLTVNRTLRLGGSWGSLNEIEHEDGFDSCNVTKISTCGEDNNIPGEIRQCFLRSDAISSFAMNLFNVTADNVQMLKVDTKIAQLPFPDPFNVRISQVNHINGCDGNPIVCHTMMTGLSDCDTVYLCHSVKGTTVEQVIIDYNEEVDGVQMYAMCHMDTYNFSEEHVAFRMLDKHPGDSICHFISANSFLVCKI
jgi:hypothetical protein